MLKFSGMEKMTINERIKELRIENGLTQKQLADAIGTSQTTVASHEKSHDPNIYILMKYADFFECTLDFLAGRETGDLPYVLSAQERELVKAFRGLNPDCRTYALKQICLLSESKLNK